jgi:hypothetical protein
MASSPNLYSRQRAPRAKLAGSVLALIELENQHQVHAKLNQLSINGGLLQLTEPLEEQVPMQVMFHLGSTTVRAQAETISPLWATQGCLQPFRFTDLGEDDRRRLDADLQSLFGIASAMTDNAEPVPPSEEPNPIISALVTNSEEQVVTYREDSPPPTTSLAESGLQGSPEISRETECSDSLSACEVTVYFDKPEDALRFTVALSALLFTEERAREDVAKLIREMGKVSRVTTKGLLQPAGVVEETASAVLN